MGHSSDLDPVRTDHIMFRFSCPFEFFCQHVMSSITTAFNVCLKTQVYPAFSVHSFLSVK
jgi:hypothetical protein